MNTKTAFSFNVDSLAKGFVVRVVGKAGGPESEQLETELNRLAALNPSLVVLDLAGLEYLSSLGISAIIRLHKLLREKGGIVRLASVPAPVFSLLSAAHVDRLVPVFPDAASASK